MPYGKLALDTIETSGSLAVTGNVTTTGTLQPSALRSLAANTAPMFQDSTGTEIGELCRCWGQVQLSSGTPNVVNGFNISSVTYVSTGNWDINLITPLTNTEGFTGFITAAGDYNITYSIIRGSSTTSKIRIWCKTNANAFYNPGVLYFGFFW